MKTSRVLGVVVAILLVVATVWGLLTYGLVEYPAFPLAGGASAAADVGGTVLVLAIGLLGGYVSSRYLMTRHEPPGDIWMVLTAGVGGAWLGGALLPAPGCWRWQGINVPGSIALAFVLAVGAGWLGARWRGKGGDR